MSIRLKNPVAEAMRLSVALLQEGHMLSQSRAGQVGYQGNSKANGLFSTYPGKGENAAYLHVYPGRAMQIALPPKRPAMDLMLSLPALSCAALAWHILCLTFSRYLCVSINYDKFKEEKGAGAGVRLAPKLATEWLSDGETSSLGGRSQKSCLIPAARNIDGSEAGQSPDNSAGDPTQDSKLQQRAASMDSGDRLLLKEQLPQQESKAGSGACSLDGAGQECGSTAGSLPEFHSPHSSLSQRSLRLHRDTSCSRSSASQASPAGEHDGALDRGKGDPDHACSLSASSALMRNAASNPLCSSSVTSTGSSTALPQRQLYWPQAQYGGAAATSLPSTVGSSIPEDNVSEASISILDSKAIEALELASVGSQRHAPPLQGLRH